MADNNLFLYGTLRQVFNKPMYRFIEKHSTCLGEATVQGKLYNIITYPGVVQFAHNADRVVGEIYQLHDPDLVFEKLDPYEYCGPNDPKPHEYIRELTGAKLNSGDLIQTWIYWYNYKVNSDRYIKSGDYLEFVNQK